MFLHTCLSVQLEKFCSQLTRNVCWSVERFPPLISMSLVLFMTNSLNASVFVCNVSWVDEVKFVGLLTDTRLPSNAPPISFVRRWTSRSAGVGKGWQSRHSSTSSFGCILILCRRSSPEGWLRGFPMLVEKGISLRTREITRKKHKKAAEIMFDRRRLRGLFVGLMRMRLV